MTIKITRNFIILFFVFLLLSIKISHVFHLIHTKNIISLGLEVQADTPQEDKNPSDKQESQQERPNKEKISSPPLSSSPSTSPFDLLDLPPSEIEILLNLLEVKKNTLDKEVQMIRQEKNMNQLVREQLDKKISELKALKIALEESFHKYTEQQKEEFKNTARIYDNIPPEKAALILSDLKDDDIVNLITMMKKSAAVIAAMPVEKAKRLTSLLISRKKLNNA